MGVESCNASQVIELNAYMRDWMVDWKRSGTAHRAGNGAFLYSCHTHTSELSSHDFRTIEVEGFSMQQAVGVWWNSSLTDPAEKHTYVDCTYKQTSPHGCNPTCSAQNRR